MWWWQTPAASLLASLLLGWFVFSFTGFFDWIAQTVVDWKDFREFGLAKRIRSFPFNGAGYFHVFLDVSMQYAVTLTLNFLVLLTIITRVFESKLLKWQTFHNDNATSATEVAVRGTIGGAARNSWAVQHGIGQNHVQ